MQTSTIATSQPIKQQPFGSRQNPKPLASGADIEKYCHHCVVCQCCKLAIPQKAPHVFNTHRPAI